MKVLWVIAIAVIVIAGGIYLLTSHTSNTNTANSTNTSSAATVNNGNAVAESLLNTASGASSMINVTDSGFSPASLTISLGQSVSWINDSSATVYVAPDNHPTHTKYAGIWDDTGAGQVTPGQTYTFTFPQAGTYTYHDHLHASHTGTIIVQ